MKNNEGKNTRMMPAVCPQCGGPVEVNTPRANAICQYCGSQFIVEKPKTSAVESVLSFVKDQQKRYDDGKIERKEEERKAREESLKYLWILIALTIMLGFFVFMLREEEKGDKISVDNSSSQLVGKNYKDVVIKLKENGFVNIKTEAMEDLIIGLFTTDGEVEQVEIDGDIDFSSGAKFAKDAEIIVTYHTFPATK